MPQLGLGLGLHKGNKLFKKLLAAIYITTDDKIYVTSDNFIYVTKGEL